MYKNRLRKTRRSCGADLGYTSASSNFTFENIYLENYNNSINHIQKPRSCSNDSSASVKFFYHGQYNHISYLYSLVSHLQVFFKNLKMKLKLS